MITQFLKVYYCPNTGEETC